MNQYKLSKEDIIKGNILIALFLGWKIDNSFPDKDRIYRSPKNQIELDTTLKFHTSFDLLIPILRKIDEWGNKTFGRIEPSHINPAIMDLTSLWILVVHEIHIINSWENKKS